MCANTSAWEFEYSKTLIKDNLRTMLRNKEKGVRKDVSEIDGEVE